MARGTGADPTEARSAGSVSNGDWPPHNSPPTLDAICTLEVLDTYPEEAMSQAPERINTRGLHSLPVVSARRRRGRR